MSNKVYRPDRIDYAILATLQQEGRISNVELASRINLSPSPCLERVRRLENEGYIERYSAQLDAGKLGLGLVAYVQVTLDRTTADVFDRFKQSIVELPEVAGCDMVAGGFDYLVKLRIANMEAYRDVLGQLVEVAGVSQTHTYIVIENVKQDRGVPIDNS